MTYQRKTRDEFLILTNYGPYGWEESTSEESFIEARKRLKEYRENMPEFSHKIKKIRVKKD